MTIQAQILRLIRTLRAEHGTAVLLITHDLGVVAGLADRVAVMYAGRIVESATTTAIPPANWLRQYGGTQRQGKRPAAANPSVTAGLKCAAEICPQV